MCVYIYCTLGVLGIGSSILVLMAYARRKRTLDDGFGVLIVHFLLVNLGLSILQTPFASAAGFLRG